MWADQQRHRVFEGPDSQVPDLIGILRRPEPLPIGKIGTTTGALLLSSYGATDNLMSAASRLCVKPFLAIVNPKCPSLDNK